MNTWQIVGLVVLGYLLLKEYGSGSGSLFGGGGSGTPTGGGGSPSPAGPTMAQLQACAAAGGVWDPTTNSCVPANVVTAATDPTTLAAKLLALAAAQGYTGNPLLTYDQWNWFAQNRMQPPLPSPDFTPVAPRDASGQTPKVTALQFAQDFVHLSAMSKPGGGGVSGGVSGLARLGNVIDMRRSQSKWTM